MVYLAPFLSLIKASDVSGPVTGAAAVALQRILQSDLLSRLRSGAPLLGAVAKTWVYMAVDDASCSLVTLR
jgi:hypothetical protein